MKKIALTLGAAVVALTAIQATDAQAGGKKFGFHNKHFHAFHGHQTYHCFWKKKKIFFPGGWYWKKVKVCKPIYFH